VLESSTPADGAELATSPTHIALTFNEPVTPTGPGLRVYDGAGTAVRVGPPDATPPSLLQVPIERRLPAGSYIATWRVASADGHPVRGALVFSVGDPSRVDADVMRQVFGTGDQWWVAGGVVVLRWLLYAGVLAAAGGAIFLRWVADTRDRSRLAASVRRAAVVGAVAAACTVPLQAAQASGVGAAVLDGDLMLATVRTSVGLQTALVVLGLSVLALALHHHADALSDVLAGAGGAVALAALLVAGHTRTTAPAVLVLAADAAHVAAGAVWLGGLLLLWPAVRLRRGAHDPVGAAGVVSRFSRLATVAVLAVTAAGTALAWALVRTVTALVATTYGRVLLVKVAAAMIVVALGAYNNRRLVPTLRTVVDDPTPADGVPRSSAGAPAVEVAQASDARHARAWALLDRTVRWEIATLATVLAVTAGLVGIQPAAEAAGVTGAFTAAVPMAGGRELNLVVDPNQVGVNEMHMYLLGPSGRPVAAQQLRLRLSLPTEDIGPIVRTASPISPGHWVHVGGELALPGRWRIEAQATISRFERPTTTVDVEVRPGS